MGVPDLRYKNQPHLKLTLKMGNQMKVHFLRFHDHATQGHPVYYAVGDARCTKAVQDHTWRVERLLLVTAVSRGGMLPRKSSIIAGCRAEIWNRIRELS